MVGKCHFPLEVKIIILIIKLTSKLSNLSNESKFISDVVNV